MRNMLLILGWRYRLSSGSGGVGSSYADLLNSSGGGAGVTSNEDMPLTDVGRMVTGLLDVLDGCFNILAGGDSLRQFPSLQALWKLNTILKWQGFIFVDGPGVRAPSQPPLVTSPSASSSESKSSPQKAKSIASTEDRRAKVSFFLDFA